MAINDQVSATYISGTSFSVAGDRTSVFVTGSRVKANCGVNGYFYGTVSTATFSTVTTVVITMDFGALTSNLTGVWWGNDVPASLPAHASLHATGARDALTPANIGAIPATTGAATAYVSAATESAAGIVELTTTAEAQAGTDTSRAMTAAGVVAAIAAATGIDAPDLMRVLGLGTAAFIDMTVLHASATWDAGSCANAAQVSTTIAAPGATIDDFVQASCSISLAGLHLRGVVTAANVVTIYLSNLTGAAVDLGSATYYIRVTKRLAVR